MTDPAPDLPTDGDLRRRLRAVDRRLRRERAALERLNPVEEPERYVEGFTGLVELEATRRQLREAIGPDGDGDDDPDAT